jgi:hypothetical protein
VVGERMNEEERERETMTLMMCVKHFYGSWYSTKGEAGCWELNAAAVDTKASTSVSSTSPPEREEKFYCL